MYSDITLPHATPRSFKILVLDEDDALATRLATMVSCGDCEVICCHDMAVAETALEILDFDLILAAPSSTGLDGLDGLAVGDFFAARKPTAVTVLLVPEDRDKAVLSDGGSHQRRLSVPVRAGALRSLLTELGIPQRSDDDEE